VLLSSISQRLSLQSGDRHRLQLMIPVFFSLGMGEVLGISSATSIFNIRYGVEYLPLMYVLEAAGLLLASLAIADMSGRMKRARFLRVAYGIMAGLILINGLVLLLVKLNGGAPGALFYPFLLVSSMVVFFQLTPLIWLVAVDICPTQQAKRLFPILAGSSTIGCIIAGVVAKGLAPAGVEIIYCLWAFFLLAGGYFLSRTIQYYIVPVNLTEAEESADLKDSIKSVYQSRFLLSMLGLLTFIMVLNFVMDYQFNTVARLAYHNEADLAGFLAVFLAISNLVAVVIELGFLSRIMAALGVGNIILLVTIGLGSCFLLMVFLGTGPLALGTVFMGYLVTKIMVNVLGEPSYQLLFKVVPAKERDGVRFLVEALFILGGMLGGAALSALHSQGLLSLQTVSALALLLAFITIYIAWQTRAMYLNELIKSIAQGFQELKENGSSLLGNLVPAGFLTRLLTFLHYPDDRIRGLVMEIMGQIDPGRLQPWINDLLQDPNAEVRSQALKYCARMETSHYRRDLVLAACTDDNPEVRSAALPLVMTLDNSSTLLDAALFDSNPLVVAQAVKTLCASPTPADPEKIRATVQRCLEGPPASAAMICEAIGTAGLTEFAPHLLALLEAEPSLQAAACEALGKLQYLDAIPPIIALYAESDRAFQQIADQALQNMGEAAIEVLWHELPLYRDLHSWLAVIKAAAACPATEKYSRLLVDSCLIQLDQLNRFARLPVWLAAAHLPELAGLAKQRCQEIQELQMEACWSVMGGLYDAFVIERVKAASQQFDPELKDTSLEILSEGLVDRRLARAMLEVINRPPDRQPAAKSAEGKEFLQEARSWRDDWLSEIAEAACSRLEGGNEVDEQEMLSRLDKVLLLKRHELFSCLQLDELGHVARVARQEIYEENSVLMEEGQPNTRLYLIIKGKVELSAHSLTGVNATIAVLGAGEAVGDNTVFDEAVSPITAEVILDDAALLTIDGQDIKHLCSLYPSIANGFIRAMSARVRRLEQMLTKMA